MFPVRVNKSLPEVSEGGSVSPRLLWESASSGGVGGLVRLAVFETMRII